MEYDYLAYMGNSVPKSITDEMYDKLMDCDSGEGRRSLWEMFSRREAAGDLGLVMKRRMAQHRVARMMEKVKAVEKDNFDGKVYNQIGQNKAGAPFNILPRIDSTYAKQRFHPRVLHGIQFGQNIVFDLGLPFNMDKSAERRFNTHMKSVYNRNRTLWDPFNIFMCNYDPSNLALKRLVDDHSCSSYLWNVTRKCFTDIFPRDKIVYLSPKSNQVLSEFHHDDIYVIGATGEHGSTLCHYKIKELGLRSARLNVDPYFMRSGKNNFDVKEMFRILVDARDTDSNWLYSLRHLSNPKMRVVRWRTKYQHLQHFVDEETKNQVTLDLDCMNERYTEAHDHVFTNERSILKPRHEDAALFKDDTSASLAEHKHDARHSIEVVDGAINVDRNDLDDWDATSSNLDWDEWELKDDDEEDGLNQTEDMNSEREPKRTVEKHS